MADIRAVTTQLDDFERPAENPLRGPTGVEWEQLITDGSRPDLRLVTNDNDGPVYGGSAANQTSGSIFYSMWHETFPAGDIEVWGFPTGGEAGAALTGWRIGFVMANSVPDSGGNSMDGYIFLRETALGDFIYWRRYNNNTFVDLNPPDFGPTTETYKPLFLVRKVGSTLESWVCSNTAGTGTWTLITQDYGETTWNGPWRILLGIEDGTHAGTGWLGFGGGVRRSTTGYPKIIRRDPRNEFWLPNPLKWIPGSGNGLLGG